MGCLLLAPISNPFNLWIQIIKLRLVIFSTDSDKGVLCGQTEGPPYVTQGGQSSVWRGSRVQDGTWRTETARSPLTRRRWLPETLVRRAQRPQMKAKPIMTNKLGRATRRWNLQMRSLSASRNKSCCGVRIEFHCSSARHWRGSLFIGADGQKIHFVRSVLYMESRC